MITAPTAKLVRVAELMGTVMSVHVIGEPGDPEAVERAIERCFDGLADDERVFSPFRADSDISRLRDGSIVVGEADPRVAEVERACADVAEATAGLFSAWRNGWFDPTGYVKGWAVERAATRSLQPLLTQPGVVAVGINAGGDLRLFTNPGSGWSWQVGIADPQRAGGILATLDVVDGAVATSGLAERGAHIVDPRTGAAALGALSATVVADDLITADVWATAAVVSGADDLSWIARAPTRTGMVVAPDGSVRRWLGAVEIDVVPAI